MSAPDRSEFVRWCEQQFAHAPDMKALFALVDTIQTRRATVRQEGNREADERITRAVQAAYRRLGGNPFA